MLIAEGYDGLQHKGKMNAIFFAAPAGVRSKEKLQSMNQQYEIA